MSDNPFSFDALSKYSDAVFQLSDTVTPQQQVECPESLTTIINSTTPISKNQLESKLQYITNCSNRLTIPYSSFDPEINSYNKINDSTYGSEDKVIAGYGANMYYLKRVKKTNLFLSKVKHKFSIIINPTITGRFSGIYSEFEIESNDGRYSTTIPIVLTEDEYNSGRFGRKLNGIITNRANQEYKEKYAVALYYQLIQDEISMKSNCFIPPPCSGWSKLPEGLFFASANSVNPIMYDYLDRNRKKHQIPCYPDDILNRTLLYTKRVFSDVAKEYKDRLPDNWKYKLIVVIRVASLLLYFFKQKDIEPDQIFIIEPSKNTDAKDVIALLQTVNYDDYSPILMPFTQTKYKNICKKTFSNDGIALFRDESLVEEKSTIASNIRLLKNSIKYHSTHENNKRQIFAIITDNQIIGSDDTSAIQLTFQDVDYLPDEQDIKYIQKLSGQFDFSLIQYIIDNESEMTAKIYSLIDKYKEVTTDEYHERINTICILETTMEFLKEYEVINSSDISAIRKWYSSDNNTISDNRDQIVEGFYDALNELIHSGKIKLANQFVEPFYDETQNMAFESSGYLNFNAIVCKKMIIPQIRKTMQSTLVLNTLYEDSLLAIKPSKKHDSGVYEYTRKVTFASPTANKQKRLYSISTEFLDSQSKSMLEAIKNYDFFYITTQIPSSNFVPIINSIGDTYTSGIKITPDSDENFHMYVTGASGAGKTFFLLQQTLFRAQTNDKVIIFDNGGYFRPDRLKRIFQDKTDDIINKYFSFHFIPEDKIPVDLFSLENCDGKDTSLVHSQAMRLYNILTAASGNLGEKQSSTLTEELKNIVSMITSENLSDVSDEYYTQKICDSISDMLQSKKMIKNGVDERLSSIISYIKGRGIHRQTWSEFIDRQKKIVVITTEKERNKLGGNLIDLMLASLSAYKSYTESQRFTVIIDEISFLNLSGSSTINSFAREGRHKKISLLLASQDFMKEKLNDLFGNFGTMIFFKPTDAKVVASYINSTNIDSNFLSNLKTGELVVKGNLFSKSQNRNKTAVFYGKTANFIGSSFYPLENTREEIFGDAKLSDAECNKGTRVKLLRRIKKEEPAIPIKKSDNQSTEPLQDSDIIDSSQNTDTIAEHNAPPKVSQSHLKITVLIEDTTNCELDSENGLSLYIEYNDKKILFDAGRENLFAKNADLMLIDLSEIDFGILSHAHCNHSDGFPEFFLWNKNAPVYAREEIKEEYYSATASAEFMYMDESTIAFKSWEYDPPYHDMPNSKGIGKNVRTVLDRFILINQNQKIDEGIFLVGHDTPHLDEFGKKQYLYRYETNFEYSYDNNCPFIPDSFKHEQCLVLDTPKGLVIFSGCSHGGVINTIREAKKFCGYKPIYAYIGGFHMKKIVHKGYGNYEDCIFSDNEIMRLCDFIKKEDIQHIYTGHCTGETGFKKLKEHLGDRVHRLTTGLEFKL